MANAIINYNKSIIKLGGIMTGVTLAIKVIGFNNPRRVMQLKVATGAFVATSPGTILTGWVLHLAVCGVVNWVSRIMEEGITDCNFGRELSTSDKILRVFITVTNGILTLSIGKHIIETIKLIGLF